MEQPCLEKQASKIFALVDWQTGLERGLELSLVLLGTSHSRLPPSSSIRLD